MRRMPTNRVYEDDKTEPYFWEDMNLGMMLFASGDAAKSSSSRYLIGRLVVRLLSAVRETLLSPVLHFIAVEQSKRGK